MSSTLTQQGEVLESTQQVASVDLDNILESPRDLNNRVAREAWQRYEADARRKATDFESGRSEENGNADNHTAQGSSDETSDSDSDSSDSDSDEVGFLDTLSTKKKVAAAAIVASLVLVGAIVVVVACGKPWGGKKTVKTQQDVDEVSEDVVSGKKKNVILQGPKTLRRSKSLLESQVQNTEEGKKVVLKMSTALTDRTELRQSQLQQREDENKKPISTKSSPQTQENKIESVKDRGLRRTKTAANLNMARNTDGDKWWCGFTEEERRKIMLGKKGARWMQLMAELKSSELQNVGEKMKVIAQKQDEYLRVSERDVYMD